MEKREQILEASLEEADKKCCHIPKHGRRSLKSEQDEMGDAAKHRQYERDNKHFLEMQSRKKKLSWGGWVSPTERKGEPIKAKSLPSTVDSDDEPGQPLVVKVTMAQLVKDKLEPGGVLTLSPANLRHHNAQLDGGVCGGQVIGQDLFVPQSSLSELTSPLDTQESQELLSEASKTSSDLSQR